MGNPTVHVHVESDLPLGDHESHSRHQSDFESLYIVKEPGLAIRHC